MEKVIYVKRIKLFLFPLLLFLYNPTITNQIYSQTKWTWQNPLPQGADMFEVFALSNNRAIITGSGGTIMTTEDEGQNWHIQRLAQVDWVRKYSFISEYKGWIIGNWYDITTNNSISKIFKTNDGGFSWQEFSIYIDIDFSIYRLDEIEFINEKNGYLLANPALPPQDQDPYAGLIYKTEDGGINWTLINTGIPRKYYQIIFTDSLKGFLLSQPYYSDFDFENNLLHKTTDGGTTWITISGQGYGRINFIDDYIGWAGNFKTTDGGQTWYYNQFNFPPFINNADKIWFVDSLTGYSISYKTILKTQDGGNSWLIQTEVNNGLLQDIQFYDSQIGYACGYGGTIYKTNNGGENWIRYGDGVTENLADVDFINENIGWVVGDYGTILHTTNGGNLWERQSIPAEIDSVNFTGVDFLDSEKGWATGGSYILKTGNGGIDWQINFKGELDFGAAKGRFRDINFLNENIGFTIGQKETGNIFPDGVIYKTTNGGKNWQRVDENNLPPLDKIYFVDNDYGWICGWGILLSTKDGGNSWQTDYFPEFLRYIQFTDREHGWISAIDEAAVYRTTNGGKIWIDIPYDNRYDHFFKSFFFFNNNQGLASTFLFCNILSSEDGGTHWTYEERLPSFQLNVIIFINDSLGWAVGTNGAILKFCGSYFDTTNNVQKQVDVAGNYPNPFNSSTTIYFFLSQPENVTISIYNIVGQCIETFTFYNTKEGKNEMHWQPQNLSSGLYLIRIQCDEFIKVIKGLLIK